MCDHVPAGRLAMLAMFGYGAQVRLAAQLSEPSTVASVLWHVLYYHVGSVDTASALHCPCLDMSSVSCAHTTSALHGHPCVPRKHHRKY